MQRIIKLLQENERLMLLAKRAIYNHYCIKDGKLVAFDELHCKECDSRFGNCFDTLLEWLSEEVE